MFEWAVSVGIYTYLLFFLGVFGQLSATSILISTIFFLGVTAYICKKKLSFAGCKELSSAPLSKHLLVLLATQLIINLIGALGPELGFDAIWYHLTIPRIWLLEGRIFYIPGGAFGYSLLPKLIELLYLPALMFSNEVAAKLIHCFFGVLCVVVTYKIGRIILNQTYSLIAAVIFYSNLVVGWQSITAYIDLGRTFFEALALLAFCYFVKEKRDKWLWWCGVCLGLAVTSKLIALGSVAIFAVLLFKSNLKKWIVPICGIGCLFPLPWFIVNYLATSNPVTPIFAGYDLSSTRSIWDFVTIWLAAADPVSPLYLLVAPLLLFSLSPRTTILLQKLPETHIKLVKTVGWYSLTALVIWWLTPRTGGGRFLLPYLPAFSVGTAVLIHSLKDTFLKTAFIVTVITLAGTSIGYRALANAQYLPVLLGQEKKANFLARKLNFSFSENWYYLSDDSLKQVYQNPPEKKPPQ